MSRPGPLQLLRHPRPGLCGLLQHQQEVVLQWPREHLRQVGRSSTSWGAPRVSCEGQSHLSAADKPCRSRPQLAQPEADGLCERLPRPHPPWVLPGAGGCLPPCWGTLALVPRRRTQASSESRRGTHRSTPATSGCWDGVDGGDGRPGSLMASWGAGGALCRWLGEMQAEPAWLTWSRRGTGSSRRWVTPQQGPTSGSCVVCHRGCLPGELGQGLTPSCPVECGLPSQVPAPGACGPLQRLYKTSVFTVADIPVLFPECF